MRSFKRPKSKRLENGIWVVGDGRSGFCSFLQEQEASFPTLGAFEPLKIDKAWPNLLWVGNILFFKADHIKMDHEKAKMDLRGMRSTIVEECIFIRHRSVGAAGRESYLHDYSSRPNLCQFKAQRSFEKYMRHLKLHFVPAQRRRHQQFYQCFQGIIYAVQSYRTVLGRRSPYSNRWKL